MKQILFLLLLLIGCGGTAVPPAKHPSLQTRPADGMTMLHIPGGVFQMGSSDAEIEEAIALRR